MPRTLPTRLQATCQDDPDSAAWLARLPALLTALEGQWRVTLGEPFDGEGVSCSWVAPATRHDGTKVMFKAGLPHFEAEQEIAGLQFWGGDGVVRVYEADAARHVFLMERCLPGRRLRECSLGEQDAQLAALLPRLWRPPVSPHPFRPLAAQMAYWADATRKDEARWSDPGLVRAGLELFEALSTPQEADVLLATDLHADNILQAEREPWLVIDPKPFVGDRTYDLTQHLLNEPERLRTRPEQTIRHLADLLGLDAVRLRLWVFARAAADPRGDWSDLSLAKRLDL